ncbi:MAG: HAD family hydrolase [Oscillospiraceae bacterium]|nr:HAD family hydrolase [Oscillospiraceae bacterium]
MITITNILDCETYLNQVDAVIFDLDDTLYSEKDYVRSGYAAVAQAFPQILHMADKLWNAFEQKLPAIDVVLEDAGISTPENKQKALQIYRNQKPVIDPYPGVHALLQRLRGEKKLGMITDGRPEGQWAKIESLNLQPYFQKIIVSDELGGVAFRKPNETAFCVMQKALSVPFEKMVYIGDNTRKDFIAPQKLGMQTIYFNNPDGLYTG